MIAHDAAHLVAIGFTVLAIGVHACRWTRSSVSSLIAAILMLSAMADAAFIHLLSTVVWIPLLLGAAIAVAAARSVRQRSAGTDAGALVCVSTHEPLGLVVTAAILPLMHAAPGEVGDHEGHGAPLGFLIAVVLLISAGHVLGSLLASVRSSTLAGRVQFAAMGLASLFMALPVGWAATPL